MKLACDETRISITAESRPQWQSSEHNLEPLKLEDLKIGETLLDIRRVPDQKDERGWRGPALLLDDGSGTNSVIVKY